MDPELAEQVLTFVADETRTRRMRLSLETELLRDIGLDGQDAADFLVKFANRFNVDLNGLEFNTHFGPEGLGCLPAMVLQSLIFRLGGRRTPRPIPITIHDLIAAAQSGKWTIG